MNWHPDLAVYTCMIFNLTLLGNFLILLNYHPAEVGSVKKEDSVEVKKEAEDKVYKWNQPQTCEKCGDVLKSLGGNSIEKVWLEFRHEKSLEFWHDIPTG